MARDQGGAPQSGADRRVRVVFVCTGNICRSPMADSMARRAFADAELGDRVIVSSVGTGDWHVGDRMDHRAAAELEAHGFDSTHTAAQLSESDHDADLLVVLDGGHRTHLLEVGVDTDRIRLLRSFDPDADGSDVADPYYGDRSGFTCTREQIAAALPGLVAEVRDLLG